MEGYPYQFSGDPRTVTHVTMPPSQPPVVYSPYVTHPSSPPAFYPTQLPPYPASAPYTPVYVQPQLQHPPPQLLQQQHPPLQQQHPNPQQHLLRQHHQQQHPVQQILPQQEHPNPLQSSAQQHLHLQHHPPSTAPREMILILPPAAPTLTTMVRPSLMTTMVSKTATITSAASVSQSSVTSVLTTTLPPDPEMEAVFRKFAEVVQAADAIEATDEQVLNVFLQLTKKERKLVMAEGSIRSFLSKCDYITVTGNTLSLVKLPPSRLHDVNNAGIVFEHSVYKSKDSAVELFEDRAYRCGISLEKDGVDSEESVNSISQSSHCQSDPKVAVAFCQDQISNGHRPHACTTKWSVAAGEVTDDLLTTQLVKSKGQSVATLKTTYTPLTYAADYKNRLSDSESADECDNISSSNKGKDMNVARGHFVSMRSALQQFKETLFVKSSDPVDTVAKRLVYDAMCGALDKVTRSRKSYPTSKQNHVLRAESSTFVPRTRPALAASSSNQLNASSPEFRPQSAISLERGSSGDALSHRGVCSVPSLRLQRCVSTYNCGVQTETLPQTSVMTNTKRQRTKDCGTQTPPQPCCDVAINTTDSLFDHRFRYHLVPIVTTTDTGVNTTKINMLSLKSQCSVPSEDESTMTLENEALQVRQRTVSEIEDGNVRSMATLVRTDSEQSADGIEPTLATADVSGQPPEPSLKEAAYKKPPGLPNIQQPVKKSKKAAKALKAKTLALKAEVVSEETADICPANTAAVRPSNFPVLPIQPVGESRRTEPVNPTADSEEREWEDSADPHVSTPTDLTISTMTHNDPLLQQMMLTLLKVNPALSADPRLLQMTAMSHMVALQQMQQQQQQQQQQSVQQPAIHDLQQPAIHDPQQPAIHDPQQPMIHDTQQPMIHDQHQRVIHDLQQPMIHDTQQAMIHDLHQRVIHDPQQPMIHDTQQPMIHDQHQRVIHDPQQPMIHDPQLDPQQLVFHDPRQPMIHNQQQPVIHDPQQLVFHDQQQLMIHDPHQTELLQKQQQLQLLQQQQQQMQQQQQLRHQKWMEMQHRSVETPESNSSSQGRILETPPYRELHTQPESVAAREMLPLQPSEHDPSNLRPPQNWPSQHRASELGLSQQESTERRPSQLKSPQDVRSQLEHPQAASTKVRPSKLRPTVVPEPSQRATNTRNSGQTDVPSPTDNGGRPELRGKVVPCTQDDVKQQSVVQPGHRVSGFLGRVLRKTTVANTAAMNEFSTSRNLNNGNVHERSTEMASGEDWDTEIDPYTTTWKMNEVPLPESVKEPPKPPIPGLVQKPSKKKGVMTQDVNPQPVTPVKVAPPPQTQAPQRSFPGNFFKKPPALVTPTLIPISSLANRGESESRLNLADNSAFPGLPSHRQQKKACVSSSMSELSDISLKSSTTDSVSLLCNIPMSSVASLGFSGVADTLLGQQGGDMFEDFDISSHANWQPVVGKKKKGDHTEKQMNSFEKLIVKMKEMHPDATQAVLHDAIKQVRQKHAGLKGVHMSQVISDASKIIGSARSTDSVAREGGDATDPVNKINYKTRICQFWQSGTCVQGDQCGYAHGKKELRQMPRKTQMCQNILKGYCQFGDQCSFAHSEDELKKSKPQAQQTKPAPLPKVLRPMKSAKPTPAPAITPSWGGWSDTSGSRPTHVTELDEMDDVECVICCDGIKPKDSKMLECGHVFHDKCIRQWVLGVGTRTCPTCRSHALLAEDFPKLG